MARIAHFKTLLPSALALLVTAAACGDDSSVGSGGAGAGGSGIGGSGTGGSGIGGSGGLGTGGSGGSGTGGSGGSGTGGSGTGGSGTGGSGGLGTGGSGGATVCTPGSVLGCYDGPPGTEGLGLCTAGRQTCAADGSGYGPCDGQVTPGTEDCATAVDDDCNGQANEPDAGCLCAPGSIAACYSGPPGTRDVGACAAGQEVCGADGRSYGPCVGEVLPAAETCGTSLDDDCDGQVNEDGAGCACVPNTTAPCYSGASGTEGVGPCVGGTQQCNSDGTGFGPCVGEVTPGAETCSTPLDDDCDGQVNEDGAGCVCVPNAAVPCYSGPTGTAGVGLCAAGTRTCNALGTAFGACAGEVTPAPETCATPTDDDCDGQVNEDGAGCVCVPNAVAPCYSGPTGTAGVGQCLAGTQRCNASGTAFGACTGEVTPAAETCTTPVDDDCDGQTNEGGAGCVCVPNTAAPCYSGPTGTEGVGLCRSGTRTCNASGTAFGACTGEVNPVTEACGTPSDDDCDGQANEGCTSYATDVRPIFERLCGACHTTGSSAGLNVRTYATTQLPAGNAACVGRTKGACSQVRIQNGTMPRGRGCSGNPATDAGNPNCLTAAEQATLSAWITGGQLP